MVCDWPQAVEWWSRIVLSILVAPSFTCLLSTWTSEEGALRLCQYQWHARCWRLCTIKRLWNKYKINDFIPISYWNEDILDRLGILLKWTSTASFTFLKDDYKKIKNFLCGHSCGSCYISMVRASLEAYRMSGNHSILSSSWVLIHKSQT